MKPNVIRPIAICVFRHDGRIPAAEGYDPIKEQAFDRLIGSQSFGQLNLIPMSKPRLLSTKYSRSGDRQYQLTCARAASITAAGCRRNWNLTAYRATAALRSSPASTRTVPFQLNALDGRPVGVIFLNGGRHARRGSDVPRVSRVPGGEEVELEAVVGVEHGRRPQSLRAMSRQRHHVVVAQVISRPAASPSSCAARPPCQRRNKSSGRVMSSRSSTRLTVWLTMSSMVLRPVVEGGHRRGDERPSRPPGHGSQMAHVQRRLARAKDELAPLAENDVGGARQQVVSL